MLQLYIYYRSLCGRENTWKHNMSRDKFTKKSKGRNNGERIKIMRIVFYITFGE